MSEWLSLLDPPDEDRGEALWFGVGHGTVLVRDGVLGVEIPDEPLHGAAHFLGTLDGRHCWAVDVDGTDVPDGLRPVDLRVLYASVPERLWFLAGRAVQIVEWDRTHRFCGRCGTPTEPVAGERAKRCPNCGLLQFPRLAPAIITLIEREDEALLARGRAFGAIEMYSTLAGFVEPGENLEEAVRREVAEEVGVALGDVRFFSSQPWPFPHSLMIGFFADWASGDIRIQESEIVDARWFRFDDLPMIPPPMSIARRLIDDWVSRRARAAL